MHIPDAIMDPRVAAATTLVGALGFSYGLWRLRDCWRDRAVVLLGTTAAFLFAAQMINIPLGVAAVSGHLLGGVLAVVLLGPWGGVVAMGTVLMVQCLLFADGGVTAWGANLINMGLIGCLIGWIIYAPLTRLIGGRHGIVLASMAAAWFTVLLSAAAAAVELSLGDRVVHFGSILTWMMLVHSGIGVLEAALTGLVVQTVLATRPDLVPDPRQMPEAIPSGSGWIGSSAGRRRLARQGQAIMGGLAIALAVAAFLSPLASANPDGLEWGGERLQLSIEGESWLAAPVPDYAWPGLKYAAAATALAGVLGTLAVFGSGLLLGRVFSRPSLVEASSAEMTTHAA